MAMDGLNITEDTEMADCDADKIVTMVDVLQEQQDFEEDANAVLGASDANNCTYSQGYIKRQAIYACLTCCPESKTDPNKRAGVCLACSLNCHEHHDLVELYTKRNFRCDCGNPKFNSNPCQFITNKDDLNSNNTYNHNFSGLYCTCKRPYPDPQATVDEDMIQCIICEDWLHASHLNAVIPPNDQYSEMICKGCMDKNEFLHDYSSFAVNNESIEVDVITVNGGKSPLHCNGDAINEVVTNSKPEVSNRVDVDMVENESEASPKTESNTSNNEEMNNVQPAEKETNRKSEDKITNAEDEPSKSKEEPKEPSIEAQEQNETTADEKTDNNSDFDKTDDKLLDNTKDLISEQAMEELKDDKPALTLEKDADTIVTDNVIDESKEPMASEKSIDDDVKTIPENSSVEVTSAQKENVDKDSADAVMDAINELLDGPKEITNNESEDNNEKASKESTKDNANSTDILHSTDTETPQEHIADVAETSTAINNENRNTDVETTINKSIDEQTDTSVDSEKKDPTANSCANTDSEITNDKIDEQLDAPIGSDNTNAVTENEDKISSDVEMTNDKSIHEQADASVASENNDPALTADDNNKTVTDTEITNNDSENNGTISAINNTDINNTDTEMTNNISTDKPLDTSINSEKEESPKINQVINDISAETNENNSDMNDTNEILNKTDGKIEINENKRRLSIDMTEEISKKAKLDADKCIRPKDIKKVFKGATFWPPNFRQMLCTCGECISMYKDLQVLFLTDLEDTVSYYESIGKQKVDAGASQYERGLEALSSLDRMQQINALTEYNNMRDRLLDFLKSFKDRQEVVKEEDIKAFFAGMKPRREPDGVYFCR